MRTCVGCRVRAAKSDLLRVVAVEDQGTARLVVDHGARLPGRGASVHLDLRCVALAEQRRAFGRALRLDRPPDLTAVREHVQQHPAQQQSAQQHSAQQHSAQQSVPDPESRSTTA